MNITVLILDKNRKNKQKAFVNNYKNYAVFERMYRLPKMKNLKGAKHEKGV